MSICLCTQYLETVERKSESQRLLLVLNFNTLFVNMGQENMFTNLYYLSVLMTVIITIEKKC